MSNMTTIFLNGVSGHDGMCAFARPVLFSNAAQWMQAALPDAFGVPVWLCPQGTVSFADEAQALRALQLPEKEAHVLLIAAPLPALTAADYTRAAQLHLCVGSDVTLLCCDSDGGETAVLRDADHMVCGVGRGRGQRALPAALFRVNALRKIIGRSNSLFDAVTQITALGGLADVCPVPAMTAVTDGITAYEAQKNLMLRTNMTHIAHGVQILAPESTFIASDAKIAAGAVILPGTMIREGCQVDAGAVIGPNTILEKAAIGAGTSVNNSQVYESRIGTDGTVGPFAYVRPGCEIGDQARIGDFVELKNAKIGNGTKVSHLTYIGDAAVGERVNFGCGTVVVNYDGYVKSKTTIGDDCFIGCNTNLIAPVTLGDRVFTAAGTTVTKDVPDGALAVARVRQTTLEGWNDRRRAQKKKPE